MAEDLKGVGPMPGIGLQQRYEGRLERLKEQFDKKNTVTETSEASNKNKRLAKFKAKQTEEAATQFEALLLQQMIKSMWDTVPKNDLLSGGNAEEMYQDMFQEALAEDIAKGRGLGIKEILLEEFNKRSK